MSEEPRETPIQSRVNAFLRNEELWLASAFVVGILVIGATTLAALVAVFSLSGADLNQRVDTIYKLALIGVGVVTFCTVTWRGLISTRQTNLQRQQIERLSRQIEATEENNLAQLLQKGAELIAEKGKSAHVAAGLATLRAVAVAKNGMFAVEAMNLVADFIQDDCSDDIGSNYFRSASEVLASGAKHGRIADRDLTLKHRENGRWPNRLITGVRNVRYSGGKFAGNALEELEDRNTNYTFIEVRVEGGVIDVGFYFFRCQFVKCAISRVLFAENRRSAFSECDFSGTAIERAENMPDLRPGQNFYRASSPPVPDKEIDLTAKLLLV